MERKYIDLAALSVEIGCTFENVEVAPGVVIRQTHWTKAEYDAAKKEIQKQIQKAFYILMKKIDLKSEEKIMIISILIIVI